MYKLTSSIVILALIAVSGFFIYTLNLRPAQNSDNALTQALQFLSNNSGSKENSSNASAPSNNGESQDNESPLNVAITPTTSGNNTASKANSAATEESATEATAEHSTTGSDKSREQNLLAQYEDILEGEVININGAQTDFKAIEFNEDGNAVTALVLHGRGAHPDWPDTIQPIRTLMPEKGINTLSIQLPVISYDMDNSAYNALMPEAAKRIEDALEYLKDNGHKNIIVIAHSMGNRMFSEWLKNNNSDDLLAYIAVSASSSADVETLAKVSIPVFDIFAENDNKNILDNTPSRLSALNRGANNKSRQVEVAGADHMYKDHGKELVEVITGWLQRTGIIKSK